MRGCLCWQWSGEVSGWNPEGDVCQSPTCDSAGAGGEKLAAEETGRDSYRAEEWDRLRLISVLHIQTLEPQLCLVTEESLRCLFTVFLFVSLIQISSQGSRVKCGWCYEWKWKLWNSWKRSHTDWTPYLNAANLSQTLSPHWGGKQTLTDCSDLIIPSLTTRSDCIILSAFIWFNQAGEWGSMEIPGWVFQPLS